MRLHGSTSQKTVINTLYFSRPFPSNLISVSEDPHKISDLLSVCHHVLCHEEEPLLLECMMMNGRGLNNLQQKFWPF
jgi:hypothetical protein